MHGLALRAVQLFVTDRYGTSTWSKLVKHAGFDFDEFQPMLDYDADIAKQALRSLEAVLDRPLPDIMEDIGTYLVSHPNVESLRRLLRFGGVNFEDFLHSLDDLPGRVKLAMPDLDLPRIELREHSALNFSVTCRGNIPCFGHLLMGVLRTMADDYGALAFVDYRGGGQGSETLVITLLERSYAEGRDFVLGAVAQ